jgi:anti-anti-sigma regulatory factor
LRPKNRLIPLALLNMAFRRIILRTPEGSRSALSKVLAKLNTTIPVKDRGNLIPTFMDSTLEKGQQMLKEASDFLKVRAFNNERLRTIFIQLEGSLDFQSTKKLIKRIEMTVKRGQEKIVVDFKGVTFLSPNAANLLISDKLERLRKVGDTIRFVHLSARAAGMLEHLRERLHEWETVEEEGRSPL